MTTYIIKRILLMIPTFFLISLIIFLVLNLAPGRPGGNQVSAEGTQNSESTEARESYRIFKEQFNFDKPVLLNTRFTLDVDDVKEHVVALADYYRPACPKKGDKPKNCIEASAKPPSSAVIDAQEKLEDWGEYSVMPLYNLAKQTKRNDVKVLAINQLTVNAQGRLINEYGKKQTDAQRKANRATQAENDKIRRWKLESDAKDAEITKMVDQWGKWLDKNKDRFTYTGGEKVSRFFFDTRLAKYWSNLSRFDFGVSHRDKKPVIDTIMGKLYYTIPLSFLSIILAYLISVPLGVWSAYRQGSRADRIVTVLLFMLYSLPSFFIAVILLKLFTVSEPLQIFPTGGFEGSLPDLKTWAEYKQGFDVPKGKEGGIGHSLAAMLSIWKIQNQSLEGMTLLQRIGSIAFHVFLPIICMTYRGLASLSRYARTGVLDVIRADYIRTARAKGLGEPMVVIKHAVRNGMIPILTLLGSLLPALIGGAVIIEYVFAIPGMGMYLLDSIGARDYNAIMAILLISTILTLLGLLVSDLSYAVVDPRISFD